MVISRNIAPKNFVRLRANNQMDLLGFNEIRLTPEETLRDVARANSGRGLDDETLSALYKKTEGWVAGLMLLMETPETYPPFPAGKTFSPDEVFRYFANEIFDRMDCKTQEFLLLTSFCRP